MNLKISNIFYSIQGEGEFIGTPSIFIRFYECNLGCYFCDDLSHKRSFKEYSYEDVLKEISKYKANHIIITGGEPTLYDLNEFIAFLQERDYFVAIESNGYDFSNVKKADWITYSPKDWDKIEPRGFDEIKFVVKKGSKVEKILDYKTDKPIYIQPENELHKPNKKNTKYCVELVKENPQFKLSPQLHKLLEIE